MNTSLNRKFHILLFWCFLIFNLTIANTQTFSGFVMEESTEEALISAHIIELNSNTSSYTNAYGFFSISLENITDPTFVISYVGFQSDTIRVNENTAENLKIFLSISSLQTIEIEASKEENVEDRLDVGQLKLTAKEIKKLPAFMGETDILKAIQLTPGVQSGNEGLSSLYVRGGGPDQNLVILDDVPFYNTGHALGIFSVFNTDAIKDINLIKGGFPARYGGRLSSVLDIRMKEGNMNEFHGSASVSLIAATATIEGPIKKGKTSFLFSARRSYPDLLVRPFLRVSRFKSFFSDINLKVQHKINDKHKVYLSAYTGRDLFEIQEKEENGNITGNGVDWRNIISSARWNYQISPKLFANTSLSYAFYQIGFNGTFKSSTADLKSAYRSGIRDVRLKTNIDFIPTPDHYIKFGGELVPHRYNPGALVYNGQDDSGVLDTLLEVGALTSIESNIYLEDTWKASDRLSFNIGFHLSSFHVEGENYFSPQPRLSLNYKFSPRMSIKAAFSTMTQYINLLSSEVLTLPTDLWVPSTKKIKPQNSLQGSLGLAGTVKQKVQWSAEVFYKKMDNVLSYKEGANFLLDFENNWQNKITQGTGEAYGIELFVRKKFGKLTGWTGYTLSWNNRQFADINNGNTFPYRFDRRHDASIVASYELSDRITIAANWVYGTGNAVTIATQKFAISPDYERGVFEIPGSNIGERLVIDEKNNYRLSNYHRLDASINFFKQKKRFERTISISVYNIYNHINPYYTRVDERTVVDPTTGDLTRQFLLEEVGILPFLPSIAYKAKF